VIKNPTGPGAHKWISPDLVMVECLVGEPDQIRVADPFVVLTGRPSLVSRLRRRPAIERAEMKTPAHPVERNYDRLKTAVRAFTRAKR
jgi:hypothetical protein